MQKKSSKIVGGACASVLMLVSGVLAIVSQVEATIAQGVKVGTVNLGGMPPTEAIQRLHIWWQRQNATPLHLVWTGHSVEFPNFLPSQLGVTIDAKDTVKNLPTMTLLSEGKGIFVHSKYQNQQYPVKFKHNQADVFPVIAEINSLLPKSHPAIVHFIKGKGLFKKPEIPKYAVVSSELFDQVVDALNTNEPVALPISSGTVDITQKDLDSITGLLGSYTTYFPSSMTDRNTNIRLASMKLNGVVLMPGEEMSFNKTVGKRTRKKGYRVATVFVDGHDSSGVGGGICQVSTTLYNASLLSDIGIVERQNHSMPVGYIKLGRDATVDWGEIDLVIKNTYNFPIAITSEYQPGKLTFRIFGTPQNGQVVHIERTDFHFVQPKTQVIVDPKLQPGQRKVIRDGVRGRRIHTYRLIYVNGELIRKEDLGWSDYDSKPKIVEVGPSLGTPSQTVPPK